MCDVNFVDMSLLIFILCAIAFIPEILNEKR